MRRDEAMWTTATRSKRRRLPSKHLLRRATRLRKRWSRRLRASRRLDTRRLPIASLPVRGCARSSPSGRVCARRELLRNLDGEVVRAHDNVAQMRARLYAAISSDESEAMGEVRAGLDALGDGRDKSLDELTATREAALLADEETSSLCESVAELWSVASEEAALRQLRSFAMSGHLDATLRLHALMTTSTTERESAALCELRATERRLAALLALRSVS